MGRVAGGAASEKTQVSAERMNTAVRWDGIGTSTRLVRDHAARLALAFLKVVIWATEIVTNRPSSVL